jgi:phage terminase large subunit-like protein
LETIRVGNESLAPLVVEWAATHLGVELLPWQVHALHGLLELGEDGDLVNRSGYLSVARQNGKTVLGQALLGTWLTTFARLRGKPQTVLNTADELSLACQQFERVAPVLKDSFGFELKWGYGRMEAKGPDGSRWFVKAATPTAAHGLSVDFAWADEIWAISDEVLAQGIRPTMKARNKFTAGGSPLMLMTSTAGTEGSTAQLRYREQGLKLIDEKRANKFYFAEWSVPEGVDYMGDISWWAWANPSLGTLLQWEDMIADSEHPDRISFLRGSLNLFVAADQAWLQPGEWDKCLTSDEFPAGQTVLAVDSSLDDSRYLGVMAAVDEKNRVHVKTAFSVSTLRECQEHISDLMEDAQVRLAITPSLEAHIPQHLEKRKTIVGYGELLKWTTLTKNLILEGRICHDGEEALASHMNRAVAIKQQHAVALSSKRSPGPIELARLTVFAAGIASRPRMVGKAAMGRG